MYINEDNIYFNEIKNSLHKYIPSVEYRKSNYYGMAGFIYTMVIFISILLINIIFTNQEKLLMLRYKIYLKYIYIIVLLFHLITGHHLLFKIPILLYMIFNHLFIYVNHACMITIHI
ncbi:hypothetical protein C0Z01_00630 [Photobacterium kishitanii]|nr:hypothetical protein AYY22_02165 [Photobacterium kishitanii]PSW71537.1 hypothetical protein C0Z01_00630 [Photobacterium kishitanii]